MEFSARFSLSEMCIQGRRIFFDSHLFKYGERLPNLDIPWKAHGAWIKRWQHWRPGFRYSGDSGPLHRQRWKKVVIGFQGLRLKPWSNRLGCLVVARGSATDSSKVGGANLGQQAG